ncbi:cupin domain-containing protein [Thermaurantiacus tibetensis]|uniref:cupin domain-containing protein n=1 Tax=Thermaurantiacus tibetensis TaxID=2759035 RepID=UPI00188EF465|nr:cupin domain-containing protein [Thermaurantiacus tibetensis]
MTGRAKELIAALGLAPHPEGGWYRETLRVPAADGGRDVVTAIHFLLEEGQRSHWHRVDATEIWCWHGGSPLELRMAEGEGGPVRAIRLGGDVLAGEAVQAVVPAGWWQAGRPLGGWALVSCIVAPGFRFEGFALAPPGFEPGS